MNTSYYVKKAVWGGQTSNGVYHVADITAPLQSILDRGATSITFDRYCPIPDPLVGVVKGWAIIININGKDYYYAGIDQQRVDFTVLPINPVGRSYLSVTGINAMPVPGGPNPYQNYLFSSCIFNITNNSGATFPLPGTPSNGWVSVDCYFSTSNLPSQPLESLVSIGDIPVFIGYTLPAGATVSINVNNIPNGLFDMTRFLTGNPRILPSGLYYLYIQVRSPRGILLNEGGFSQRRYGFRIYGAELTVEGNEGNLIYS